MLWMEYLEEKRFGRALVKMFFHLNIPLQLTRSGYPLQVLP
jgi:hypothetical protein